MRRRGPSGLATPSSPPTTSQHARMTAPVESQAKTVALICGFAARDPYVATHHNTSLRTSAIESHARRSIASSCETSTSVPSYLAARAPHRRQRHAEPRGASRSAPLVGVGPHAAREKAVV
jgi:hypothetical protein